MIEILRSGRYAAVALAIAALVACGDAKNPAAGASAPPEVGVVTLRTQTVSLTSDLPGRTSPYRVAEVRPQVNGVVLKRLFTEGGEVKAGEQLYQIDPALYQAEYDARKAALARAQAQARTAALLVKRYEPLVETRAVSRQTYDDAVASRDQALADVQSAKAAQDTARINLVYTRVLSPIAGRIGRSSVTEGALVTAAQAAALATVQQIDPMYVDVTQSANQLLELQRSLASGRLQAAGRDQAAVTLTLPDGSRYEHSGMLQFSEITVDPGTGAVTLRAVFPNPDHLLLPGMFVHASLSQAVDKDALLVPQQGVTRTPSGQATALVVDGQGKVEQRIIETSRAIGTQWLVTGGLKAGDRVIVRGVQMVKPGAQVKAEEVAPEVSPAGTAAPAGETAPAPAKQPAAAG